jgi:hypothetical protein
MTKPHNIKPTIVLFSKYHCHFSNLTLLLGQEDCIFFSGHLNLHAKPETGIPYREKNYNNQTKKDRIIILSDFIHQTTESYSFIHTTQYIYEQNNQYILVR